jgi:hypothetical protein
MKKIFAMLIAMAMAVGMTGSLPLTTAETEISVTEFLSNFNQSDFGTTSATQFDLGTTIGEEQPNSDTISVKMPIAETKLQTQRQALAAKYPRDGAAKGDGYEDVIENDNGSKYTIKYDDNDNVVSKILTLPSTVKLYIGSSGEIYFYNGEERTKVENGITAFDVEDIIGDTAEPTIYAKDGLLYGYKYRSYEYENEYYSTFNPEYEGVENVLIACPRAWVGEVTVENGTALIDSYAFATCAAVTSVTVPGSVDTICMGAFQDCVSLTDVSIGEGVTGIEDSTFWNCVSLQNVTVPDSVGFIGDYTFYECNALETVEIGSGLSYIGGGVFYACTALTDINVSEDNQAYSSIDGVLFNKNATDLIKCPTAKTGDFAIPSGVVNVINNAFEDCIYIKSITIPEGVVDIGDNAFNCCKLIKSIVIPNSVTSIGEVAFYNCISLTSATIGTGVMRICNAAFTSCTVLTDINIPDSVTYMGHSVFYKCYSLESITIPGSVEAINQGTFDSCTSLKSVTIENGVTMVGQGAFQDCHSLTEITIPASVLSFGDWPFYACTSLAEINVDKDNSDFASVDGILFDKDITRLIVCPPAFAGDYVIPDTVTEIYEYAFQNCALLTSVVIPDSVTAIGWVAFDRCTSLAEVTIGAGITDSYIQDVFTNCTGITEMNVSQDNPTYISIDGVLYSKDMTSLLLCPPGKSGSIMIPSSVTDIDYSAFYACKNLTEFNVESGNENYASQDGVLFSKAMNMLIACPEGKVGKYEVPSSVTYVYSYAFAGCTLLTAITVSADNENLASVDGVLFSKDMTTLYAYPAGKTGSYAIPSSVDDIEYGAFYGATSLTGIDIPTSVGYIGDYTFYNCTSLTSVTLPESADGYGVWISFAAFKNCTSLTELIAPKKTGISYDNAFDGCDNLTIYGYPADIYDDFRRPENYARSNDIPFINIERERLVQGDIDDNKVLGITDLVIVSKAAIGRGSVSVELISAADLNDDGVINAVDISIVKYLLFRPLAHTPTSD